MFYWFKRGDALVRYEVRTLSSGLFELAVIDENGTETIKTFTDENELHARQVELEHTLTAAGWSGPHGWNV